MESGICIVLMIWLCGECDMYSVDDLTNGEWDMYSVDDMTMW